MNIFLSILKVAATYFCFYVGKDTGYKIETHLSYIIYEKLKEKFISKDFSFIFTE